GPELVDEQRVLRALRSLEEERRPAGLDRAVDDLGDLEIRVDLGGDSNQLTLALQQGNPLAKILHGHGASVWNRSRKEAPWPELSRRLSDARTSGWARDRSAKQKPEDTDASASVSEPVRQLAERDHRDEDESDGEHDEDGLLALFGGGLHTEQVQHGEN